MTHPTNAARAADILRSAGLDDAAAAAAVDALAADDIIAPDLPSPTNSDTLMPTWTVDEKTSVSSTPDGGVMVVTNGRFALYLDMDELYSYALAILAAVKQSKAKNEQYKDMYHLLYPGMDEPSKQ